MELVCNEKKTSIVIESSKSLIEPIVILMEPFVHEAVITIELPGKKVKGFCSHLYEENSAFTVPRYFSRYEEIPSRCYFVLTQNENDYGAFFCLSHRDVSASLSGISNGLALHLVSGDSHEANHIRSVLVYASGKCLHETIRSVMRRGLELTGGMGKLVSDKLPLPGWLDTLGWESGIALGKDLSHEKITDAVESLKAIGYVPGYVLLDEGWQQLALILKDKEKRMAMASFEADRERFPKGLSGIISDLHHLGVKHVGIWHGIMGYRGGIHSDLAKLYDLPPGLDGRYFLGYDLGRTFQFFYDYYGYLRQQGVSFIKVGDQGSVHSYHRPGMSITLLHKNLQAAVQAAASIQFNSAQFNTECLRNENLFYWGISRLARAGEDIDIFNPLGAMRTVRNNLANSLWLQHLMQSDFDAWLTDTPQSEMLAIFHALSGTINVIGDTKGKHNKSLLKKMLLPGGTLLKADYPLTLCEDAIFDNPLENKKVYKAYTFKGPNGIIAAFNLVAGKRTLHGTASPKDVIGLTGPLFAAFSHHNGYIGLFDYNDHFPITLKPNQSDILTFVPVKNGIAVLGCYSFFLAPGPITEVHIEEDSMHISSLVAAPMVLYCEKQILEVRCNGIVIPWEYDEKRKILSIDSRSHIEDVHSVYHIVFE